ncbi:hypothetical protein P9869_35600 [Streptomyces ossamyceticus]|nr:hypothetical protein [Streptomyces ossamyceticus]
MSTARLDSLIAEAADISQSVRMADGHTLSLSIEAGAKVATVYLWPGLDAPDTEAWEYEDNVEVWLTTGSFGEGRLFGEVPVQAVRDLIEQHGGEAVAADDDNVLAAPLAQLSRAGIRCLPWRDSAGTYVRVPFADGEEITFTGITAPDEDGRIDDVSTGHMVRDHGGWLANLEDGEIVYHSDGKGLQYEEDTAALVAAIIERAPRHGGSAPEEGPGDTAEQLAVKALAEWGITAHLDDESLIGGARNSWLVISRDQTTDGMPREDEPYIVLGLANVDDDEWPMAQRPPARPADEWRVLLGDGNGRERDVMARPAGSANGLADCVAAVAEWITMPQASPNPLTQLADLHGTFKFGYSAEDVRSVFARISDEGGPYLVCVWEYCDEDGFGGNSQFYAENDEGEFFEIKPDVYRWLSGELETPGPVDTWVCAPVPELEFLVSDDFHNYGRSED